MEKKLESLSAEELIKLRHELDKETLRRQVYVKLTRSKTTPVSTIRSRIKAIQMYIGVVTHPDHRMPTVEFVRLFEADRITPWPLTPELATMLAKLDASWGLEWKILSGDEASEEWARLRELSYSEPRGHE